MSFIIFISQSAFEVMKIGVSSEKIHENQNIIKSNSTTTA